MKKYWNVEGDRLGAAFSIPFLVFNLYYAENRLTIVVDTSIFTL